MEKAKGVHVKLQRIAEGNWGWIVCGAAFFTQFLVMGLHNCFGIMYVELLNEFDQPKAKTAWVGSIAFGLCFMMGPIVSGLCHHTSIRTVAVTGGLIFSLGVFLATVADDLIRMYLTYSVMFGIGTSFCYFPSLFILPHYFNTHLSLANGIVLAGCGVGTMCLGPIFTSLIRRYGWRMSMRLMSCLGLVLVCIGFLYKPRRRGFYIEKEKPPDVRSFFNRPKIFDRDVWGNPAFLVWVVAISLVMFGYYVPYVHLVRLAEGLGVSFEDSSLLIGYMSISQTFGKICFGRLADFPQINRLYMYQVSLLVASVANTLAPLASNLTSLTIYALVYGFFDGCFVVLIAVLTGDIVGREKMNSAFGSLYGVVAVPLTLGPPIAGWIYDAFNSYHAAFYLAGGLTTFAACLLFLVPGLLPIRITEHFPDKENVDKRLIPSVSSWSKTSCDVNSNKLNPANFILDKRYDLMKRKTSVSVFLDKYFSMPKEMGAFDHLEILSPIDPEYTIVVEKMTTV